jgi:hypothetical protein
MQAHDQGAELRHTMQGGLACGSAGFQPESSAELGYGGNAIELKALHLYTHCARSCNASFTHA